ncbi:NADH oxidase [subsurface metagenome]
MKKRKWKLLEPIKVRTLLLKNRIVMPPMETIHNNADGSVSQDTIDYYAERAKGGVGLIIVQNSHVDTIASRSERGMLSISTDHMIAGLSKLAEAIKINGAAALIQLGHGGRQTNPECNPGVQNLAPSPIPWAEGPMPKELTLEEIEAIQNAFANAARRAKWAGFDGVEIHGAHGYLIGQFISPNTNLRKDKYGGPLANRAKFVLEVIDKVRAMVGDDFTVGFRMNGDDFVSGGLTLDEAAPYAEMVANTGKIDYIHVSGATYESVLHVIPVMYYDRGHLLHLAEGVKKLVKNIPIIAVGSLDVETGEKALQEGKADLVAIGRGLIADSELPSKLAAGNIEDIRPCILGNEGCVSNLHKGKPVRCEVNPACGRETTFKLTPAAKKKVMVIGGGIAGMEAARTAAMRGCDVALVEKSNKLGGQLIEASAPEFKEPVKNLLRWAERQVNKGNIKVQLNTEATPSLVKQVNPDVLIVAVGSEFVVPPVPGKDRSFVVMAKDVLLGWKKVGAKVVVLGGGIVGCETALHVAESLKKKVIVVATRDEILIDQETFNKMVLEERLQAAGVEIHTGWLVKEITDKGVVFEDKNRQMHELKADTVIIAKGSEARRELVDKFRGLTLETYVIGDCAGGTGIYKAFEDAWRVVLQI